MTDTEMEREQMAALFDGGPLPLAPDPFEVSQCCGERRRFLPDIIAQVYGETGDVIARARKITELRLRCPKCLSRTKWIWKKPEVKR